MEKQLNKKLSKYSNKVSEDVKDFIKTKTEELTNQLNGVQVQALLKENNIVVEEMDSIQSKSNMLANLLITKDKVTIKMNTNKINRLCQKNSLDEKVIIEKILLHEYIHYYGYKNKINLIYQINKLSKLRETEEVIINRVVDNCIKIDPSITVLYELNK